ncbi:MAG: hypothetical protein ACP5OE_09885 [Thermodesulfobium sp.]
MQVQLNETVSIGKKISRWKTELLLEIKRGRSEMRNKIMSIDPETRKALKINKSTLWYEQKKIKEGKAIKMYRRTKVRIR